MPHALPVLDRKEKAAAAPELPLAKVKASLGSAQPSCTIYARSYSEHLLQIYAGLYALHESGHIRVRQRFRAAELARRLGYASLDDKLLSKALNGLFVDVEGAGLVFFDVRDGENYYPQIVDRLVIYAKRSFRRGAYAASAEKFVPLGLNYAVYLDRASSLELVRSFRQFDGSRVAAKRLLISLARIFPRVGRFLQVATVASLASRIDRSLPARAIFLARTWDQSEVVLPEEQLRRLNDFRAACVRALRQRFGARFFGGLSRSAHACRHYPDCVVDPQVSTTRRDYFKLLRGYSVCVATSGLSESIGWKFAEYVALSKAIVSEPLRFQVPGAFAAGENYLEFSTAEGCAARVAELLADDDARWRMMESNARYYAEYGSPEAVVGRVLQVALRGPLRPE